MRHVLPLNQLWPPGAIRTVQLMTCDELVRSLDTRNKAEWRATVHELLTSLPKSRDALLRGLLDDKPMVRAGCAAALDPRDHGDVVADALRLSTRDN
ncbi:MAG: hypothetical protein QOJ00_1557 [Actinomycetota bacterium]|jgi:hypothetical protein